MTFYTINDVAELFKVHVSTVKRWLKAEKLEGFKLGNEWRFTEKDIEKFVKERREETSNIKSDPTETKGSNNEN